MTPHALLFTLAAIGISETVYLIRKRKADEHPVCLIGTGCAKVLDSKFNKILGIHNDILGLSFYVGMSLLTAFLVIGVGPLETWNLLAQIGIGVSSVMSLYFTFLQWKVIKAWCFWCLMSAFTVYGMLVIVVLSNLII